MDDINVIAEFRDLITKFREAERSLVEAIMRQDFDDSAFDDISGLLIKIKEKLAEYNVLKVDDLKLRNDLIAIRENRDFLYFALLEILNGKTTPVVFGPDWDANSQEYTDVLVNEILSRIDPIDLITNKMRFGALLVGKAIPEHLKTHLSRIKDCYVWDFG